ncbi:MAG: hypothetical protein GF398_05255 [Chitinivibrionales bacterium]|nr:hypothetical protein [Chitinivibrionales bacterium]
MKASLPSRRLISYLLAALGYGGFFASVGIFVSFFIPLFVASLPFNRARVAILHQVFQSYVVLLALRYLPALGVYRYRVEGAKPERKPAVYVANHRSRIDGPLLMAIIPDTGVIMKQAYARLPLFGFLARFHHFVSVNPSSLDSLARAQKKCRSLIACGKNMLIFPEGARARSGRIMPFKDFAFRVAMDAGLPVVPVLIGSNYPFMAKGTASIIPYVPNTITIRFLEDQLPHSAESSSEFAARIRRLMSKAIVPLDKNTFWEVE